MKSKFKVTKSQCFVALTAVLLIVGFVGAIIHYGYWSSESAGWMQAIGTVVGIGIAIEVPTRMRQKQLEDEKSKQQRELRSMLLSLHDEISILWGVFSQRIGATLRDHPADQPFLYTWPVQDNPFVIYSAHADRISQIDDDLLRRAIVETYILAAGVLQSFRMNNAMVKDHSELCLLVESNTHNEHLKSTYQSRLNLLHSTMTDYCSRIRKDVGLMEQSVAQLLPLLQASASKVEA